jgi:hypothetical protein
MEMGLEQVFKNTLEYLDGQRHDGRARKLAHDVTEQYNAMLRQERREIEAYEKNPHHILAESLIDEGGAATWAGYLIDAFAPDLADSGTTFKDIAELTVTDDRVRFKITDYEVDPVTVIVSYNEED